MNDQRFNYGGIGGGVAGVVGLLGIYAGWWETDAKSYYGTADISGQLALAMSIGVFAFGVAYVVFPDQRIRRAMGALKTLCAAVLTLSARPCSRSRASGACCGPTTSPPVLPRRPGSGCRCSEASWGSPLRC